MCAGMEAWPRVVAEGGRRREEEEGRTGDETLEEGLLAQVGIVLLEVLL